MEEEENLVSVNEYYARDDLDFFDLEMKRIDSGLAGESEEEEWRDERKERNLSKERYYHRFLHWTFTFVVSKRKANFNRKKRRV